MKGRPEDFPPDLLAQATIRGVNMAALGEGDCTHTDPCRGRGASERAPSVGGRRETEAQFQSRVIALAESLGYLVYHTHYSRRSQPGFPDLCMVRDGVLIFAELKRGPKEKPTAAQERWLSELRRTGAMVYLWRPEDWQEIVSVLRGES